MNKYFLIFCMFVLAIFNGCATSSNLIQQESRQPKKGQFIWSSNHVIVQFTDQSPTQAEPLVALLPKSPKEVTASDLKDILFLTGKEVKKGIWVFELHAQVSSAFEALIVSTVTQSVTALFTKTKGETVYYPGFPYDYAEPVKAGSGSKKIAGELFEISNTRYPDHFVECIDYECLLKPKPR